MASDRQGSGWAEEEISDLVRQLASAGGEYRRLVERLPAIIYSAELGEHGRWRYVSPQVEKILGYTAEEWASDPTLWASRIHPDDRERVLGAERARTEGRQAPPPIDYRMLTRGGETVWVLDEAVLEPGDDGTSVWYGVLT